MLSPTDRNESKPSGLKTRIHSPTKRRSFWIFSPHVRVSEAVTVVDEEKIKTSQSLISLAGQLSTSTCP